MKIAIVVLLFFIFFIYVLKRAKKLKEKNDSYYKWRDMFDKSTQGDF